MKIILGSVYTGVKIYCKFSFFSYPLFMREVFFSLVTQFLIFLKMRPEFSYHILNTLLGLTNYNLHAF